MRGIAPGDRELEEFYKYKTNAAYYRPPEPKRYSIQREERGYLAPEANGARILCWIMTTPANIPKRAKSVKDTWGKRCDILLFFSSKEDPNFPAIGLKVEEGPAKLFDKTRASLEYIYNHHLNDADWFFKADDDTYAIIENLRSYLSKLNTSEPHYLGEFLLTLVFTTVVQDTILVVKHCEGLKKLWVNQAAHNTRDLRT